MASDEFFAPEPRQRDAADWQSEQDRFAQQAQARLQKTRDEEEAKRRAIAAQRQAKVDAQAERVLAEAARNEARRRALDAAEADVQWLRGFDAADGIARNERAAALADRDMERVLASELRIMALDRVKPLAVEAVRREAQRLGLPCNV